MRFLAVALLSVVLCSDAYALGLRTKRCPNGSSQYIPPPPMPSITSGVMTYCNTNRGTTTITILLTGTNFNLVWSVGAGCIVGPAMNIIDSEHMEITGVTACGTCFGLDAQSGDIQLCYDTEFTCAAPVTFPSVFITP